VSIRHTIKNNIMKITAKQIKKGMSIKVASIENKKNYLIKSLDFDFLTEDSKNYIRYLLKNNIILSVNKGSIKKDSPIIKVEDIEYISTTVGWTILVIKTNIGKVVIQSNQKVELL
tara:strand:- start:129 stop:476 length:348 start_codon:yes stop_codon:yes gene_type:complete